jgi:hypothetical protein
MRATALELAATLGGILSLGLRPGVAPRAATPAGMEADPRAEPGAKGRLAAGFPGAQNADPLAGDVAPTAVEKLPAICRNLG